MYRYTTSDKSGSYFIRPARRKQPGWAMQLVELLLGWTDQARQRRHLAELDDRLLRDIGISRVEVEAELSRPFWRPGI